MSPVKRDVDILVPTMVSVFIVGAVVLLSWDKMFPSKEKPNMQNNYIKLQQNTPK